MSDIDNQIFEISVKEMALFLATSYSKAVGHGVEWVQKNWEDFVPAAMLAYEASLNKSTSQSCWQEAAEIAEKLHDEYVEKEQFKWPEMRTEAATALGEIQAIFEAKSRGES